MIDIDNLILTYVRILSDKNSAEYKHQRGRFNKDYQMAKIHPKGQETYFKEVIYETYKKLSSEFIGSNWIEAGSPDPFQVIEKTGEYWINSFLEIWWKYAKAEEEDFIKDAKFFFEEYFYIQIVNNHMATLNKPVATPDQSFVDFFNPEFPDKEMFIDRLKEVMKGKQQQDYRFMVEALIAKNIIMVGSNENKKLFNALKQTFGDNIKTYGAIFDIPNLRKKNFQEEIKGNYMYAVPYRRIEKAINTLLAKIRE